MLPDFLWDASCCFAAGKVLPDGPVFMKHGEGSELRFVTEEEQVGGGRRGEGCWGEGWWEAEADLRELGQSSRGLEGHVTVAVAGSSVCGACFKQGSTLLLSIIATPVRHPHHPLLLSFILPSLPPPTHTHAHLHRCRRVWSWL